MCGVGSANAVVGGVWKLLWVSLWVCAEFGVLLQTCMCSFVMMWPHFRVRFIG